MAAVEVCCTDFLLRIELGRPRTALKSRSGNFVLMDGLGSRVLAPNVTLDGPAMVDTKSLLLNCGVLIQTNVDSRHSHPKYDDFVDRHLQQREGHIIDK